MNPMFYFLIAFTAVLAATANAGRPVLDTDGDPIFNGSYYLLPGIVGVGDGGLNLKPRGDKKCPLYIGQDHYNHTRGIPVKFSGWMSKVGFVPESENLNIEMDVKATICAQRTYWSVTPRDMFSRVAFIAAGPKPSDGSFQIKKIENAGIGGYRIVFCPTDKECNKVGIFVDVYGNLRVVLTFTPYIRTFDFVLVKATEEVTSSKTMSFI